MFLLQWTITCTVPEEQKLRDVLQEREGTSLNYLGLSGTTWDYLGLSGTILDYLGLSRTIKDYLELSETI